MDMLAALGEGFATASLPLNLLFILIGVLIGQLVGLLPGIGPSAGMALLLPLTFGLPPATAIMMLAGIMYGGMYGGTLTSVLINVPGEAASVMTALDGYKLARQGRAGAALSIAAVGSFIAGVAAVAVLMFLMPPLSAFALKFNAPEYFLLALLGIAAAATIGGASMLKALLAAMLGVVLGLVGTDPITGASRMSFGIPQLLDGFDFVPVAIGLFGIAEILASLNQPEPASVMQPRLRDMWMSRQDWRESRGAIARGGAIGFVVGIMPGAGPTIASLLAYVVEKRASKRPERFGEGAIDAVAAAESANNSAAHGALVPMLALGIPGSASTAVLLAALILHGIQPGPMLLTREADLVWALIASMFIGNVMLLVLNLPLAPAFCSILRIPYALLAPGILLLSLVGTYATTLDLFTTWTAIAFGFLGYAMMRLNVPRAPVVLALVLTPLMESSLRQSLMLSDGSLGIFVERPLAATLLAILLVLLLAPLVSFVVRRRRGSRMSLLDTAD